MDEKALAAMKVNLLTTVARYLSLAGAKIANEAEFAEIENLIGDAWRLTNYKIETLKGTR